MPIVGDAAETIGFELWATIPSNCLKVAKRLQRLTEALTATMRFVTQIDTVIWLNYYSLVSLIETRPCGEWNTSQDDEEMTRLMIDVTACGVRISATWETNGWSSWSRRDYTKGCSPLKNVLCESREPAERRYWTKSRKFGDGRWRRDDPTMDDCKWQRTVTRISDPRKKAYNDKKKFKDREWTGSNAPDDVERFREIWISSDDDERTKQGQSSDLNTYTSAESNDSTEDVFQWTKINRTFSERQWCTTGKTAWHVK